MSERDIDKVLAEAARYKNELPIRLRRIGMQFNGAERDDLFRAAEVVTLVGRLAGALADANSRLAALEQSP